MQIKQTISLLHASLEATNDGLLVIGRNDRIVRYNKKYLKLWRIPASLSEPLPVEDFQKMIMSH